MAWLGLEESSILLLNRTDPRGRKLLLHPHPAHTTALPTWGQYNALQSNCMAAGGTQSPGQTCSAHCSKRVQCSRTQKKMSLQVSSPGREVTRTPRGAGSGMALPACAQHPGPARLPSPEAAGCVTNSPRPQENVVYRDWELTFTDKAAPVTPFHAPRHRVPAGLLPSLPPWV